MDSITSSALEEICVSGPSGLPLAELWPKLRPSVSSAGLDFSSGVKGALWSSLLRVPALQFAARGVCYSGGDPAVQRLEEAERLGLSIVAADHLRDSFLGLYDLRAADAGICQSQRSALGLLASARTNGITQSQLAKELGKNANNMFFVVRNLECQGLVTRHSTVMRTKKACSEGESNNSSAVTTNMIYLCRYAKHLGSQQRLEITKEDKSLDSLEDVGRSAMAGDGAAGECVKDEVLINDYLPALKAICDKLEAANGKVLVISDIKRDLGFRETRGHRRWRHICKKLKDAGVVEEFCAKVDEKEVSCLRLVKQFSTKYFEQKNLGCGDDNFEEYSAKFGKKGQITDQLVELPIEHQIYDMIDAKGREGLTVVEVCRRLGISNKKYNTRLRNMFERFGVHQQFENCNKSKAYRVWTRGNFNPESHNAFPCISENLCNNDGVSTPHVEGLAFYEKSAQTILPSNSSASTDDIATSVEIKNGDIDEEFSCCPQEDVECIHMLPSPSIQQELVHEVGGTGPNAKLGLVSIATESIDALLETSPSSLAKSLKCQSYQKNSSHILTADSIQREQRILELLQEKKFVLRAELHRWLESLEQDKDTAMDRKTLIRVLKRLQEQGHCRCIDISVPLLTNCHRSRIQTVILHPSIQGLPPELLGQLHDRIRSFDMEVRREGSSRLKRELPVPVLNDVQRTSSRVNSDAQALKSEIMRANGFVKAKMVRAKMLHSFLWEYVNSLPDWDDVFSLGRDACNENPHSTCKLFALDVAIRAIPFELFLQIVGSSQQFDDLIEKCKSGLRLSDLPTQEYRRLMDTQATGRLSWIIDILRRLKLIRLVSDGHLEDGSEVPHATLKHAMELKPYIEEPLSIVASSSNFMSLDLRPRKRHDFILSNRKAVDVYWNTLEYCYSSAVPTAALHAFPGSAVHEVFFHRSWASVRVMSADQRGELLKRIVNDDPDKKLSFLECQKIAKDLNLTLEQVLCFYHDKRQQRLNRFRGGLHAKNGEFQLLKNEHPSSSRKRKRSSGRQPLKHIEVDSEAGQLEDHVEDTEEPASHEGDEVHFSFISQCAFSRMKPMRQKKFLWTEEADRQLVIQYARHRAALGTKFHRIEWASLHDLPALPSACRRRMQLLNSNMKFKKAVMRLCNMLSERYVKQLDKTQKRLPNNSDFRLMTQGSSGECLNRKFFDSVEHNLESDFEQEVWDDFDNKSIKIVLDEVLQYKKIAKLEASKRIGCTSEEWSDLNVDAEECDPQGTLLGSPTTPGEDTQKHCRERFNHSSRRSRCHRVPRKFIKLLKEGTSVDIQVFESLAVSNAVELFKLVFLSTSTAPEVPYLLAETLRRYSEHDLFAAFNYLRAKKMMVAGNGSHPFVLSQQFLQSVSSSPFPTNTGKRAAKFSSWLHEREKDTMEEGINLTADLQCGDIFHLFALVSLGELSIMPSLPDDGVGEAEDSRSLKRKAEDNEFCNDEQPKKPKSLGIEGEIKSRKAKGFPGIMISLSRKMISTDNALEIFRDGDIRTGLVPFDENDQLNTAWGQITGSSPCHSDHMEDILDYDTGIHLTEVSSESSWEAMTSYAECLMSEHPDKEQIIPFYPEHFRTAYTAIHRAGDQGLSMGEISEVLEMKGEKMAELIVDVLEVFGRVLKVNAYDSVHVVDALYRMKYFLMSTTGYSQDNPTPSIKSPGTSIDHQLILQPKKLETNCQRESNMNTDDVHKVTILNLPEEVVQFSNNIQSIEELESCRLGGKHDGETFEFSSADSHLCRPILPWINGDGTINKIVHKGLMRRILGIVMQNPGILEGDIVCRMNVLNPQSCRRLLELMILDNHLFKRKMHQTTSDSPPAILGSLLGSSFRKPKSIFREHFFANPMSTFQL
ncbi:uncharacterized protein LOC131164495 isoform X2 [Malania oleifera]|uniref:uncharacterized protein LOC131164495 isoform X2 n=1 Tax=Malania oleifera TaxID=397392 RepID=UPI0025AE67B2|nr:uncharacterized protein LOC131164495 isoform X2 [Malania oleifera]